MAEGSIKANFVCNVWKLKPPPQSVDSGSAVISVPFGLGAPPSIRLACQIQTQECIMDEATRHELFSAMASEGILASQGSELTARSAEQLGEVVQLARTYADLLIAELTREQVAGGQ